MLMDDAEAVPLPMILILEPDLYTKSPMPATSGGMRTLTPFGAIRPLASNPVMVSGILFGIIVVQNLEKDVVTYVKDTKRKQITT